MTKIDIISGFLGAGKTTLIKILMGEEDADDGEVIFSDDIKIGYLSQGANFDEKEKVIDYLIKSTNKKS